MESFNFVVLIESIRLPAPLAGKLQPNSANLCCVCGGGGGSGGSGGT